MLKSAIVLIVVSIVTMFFQTELAHVLHVLILVHDRIADGLAVIFSNAPAGRMIQETIALILIPVTIGAAIALVWLMVKRHEMPHLAATVWVIWTILLVSVLLQPSSHSSLRHNHHSSYAEQTFY